MSSCRDLIALWVGALAMAAAAIAQPQPWPGIGRAATPAEVAAWDTDVRADFKGLPKGSGSVARGQVLWEAQCASCHGVFGESNEVFTPLIGGTTAADVKTGRVARLTDPSFPGRSTLMKLPTLSTLWDYIHRAMPWNAPKSLSHDEVYALTAYMLHLGGVVGEGFTLSDANIRQVQDLLPNRKGMTTAHAMWPGTQAKPDVQGSACMRNCGPVPKVASQIPAFARDAHGNLADQNRLVGPQRGAVTARATAPATDAAITAAAAPHPALAAARQHNCMACHGLDTKLVGPGLREVARSYASRADAVAYLKGRILAGGAGIWGSIPMPAQTLPEAEAHAIAQWLAAGAP